MFPGDPKKTIIGSPLPKWQRIERQTPLLTAGKPSVSSLVSQKGCIASESNMSSITVATLNLLLRLRVLNCVLLMAAPQKFIAELPAHACATSKPFSSATALCFAALRLYGSAAE